MSEQTQSTGDTPIPVAAPKKTAKKKKAPARKKVSGKPDRAKTKAKSKKVKPSKIKRAWAKNHFQLVIHSTKDFQKKLDRNLSRLAKLFGVRPYRGAVVRACVAKMLK